MSVEMRILVIGGGPAGCFAALSARKKNTYARITIVERSSQLLPGLRVPAGQSLALSRSEEDPELLADGYIHGSSAMIGPLSRFASRQVIDWFSQQGLRLKKEEDNSVIVENGACALADCLEEAVNASNIQYLTNRVACEATRTTQGFRVWFKEGEALEANRMVIATGGSQGGLGYRIAQHFGHTIVTPVPSLLSFKVQDTRLRNLHGTKVSGVEVAIDGYGISEAGSVEVTGKGLGGTAIAAMSARIARDLAKIDYRCNIQLNWLKQSQRSGLGNTFEHFMREYSKRYIFQYCPFELPENLWTNLCVAAKIKPADMWGRVSPRKLQALIGQLTQCRFVTEGYQLHKPESVTAGGVELAETDPLTFASRITPGLYFAGEILDIDGLPSGYNMLSAWTTSWLAGCAAAT